MPAAEPTQHLSNGTTPPKLQKRASIIALEDRHLVHKFAPNGAVKMRKQCPENAETVTFEDDKASQVQKLKTPPDIETLAVASSTVESARPLTYQGERHAKSSFERGSIARSTSVSSPGAQRVSILLDPEDTMGLGLQHDSASNGYNGSALGNGSGQVRVESQLGYSTTRSQPLPPLVNSRGEVNSAKEETTTPVFIPQKTSSPEIEDRLW